MKNQFTKIISTVLALITIFSITTVSSASDLEMFSDDSESIIFEVTKETEETEVSEDAVEIEEPKEPVDPNAPVVTMYLCATAHSFTGHVWLYFDNISSEAIEVGYINLEPGRQTSVGSLRNTRTNGGGTYYNGEAFMSKNIDVTGNHTTYLQMDLNREQLATVSSQIKKRNTYNIIAWNCGNFATAVWNSVSSYKIIHITFPVFTILQMVLHGARKGLVMTRPAIEDCYKQVKGGVVNAQASSFNASCV